MFQRNSVRGRRRQNREVWRAACMRVCVCVCVQALLNCTSSPPTSDIDSREACVTLYHFRGHRRGGYFFALHVVAGYGQ